MYAFPVVVFMCCCCFYVLNVCFGVLHNTVYTPHHNTPHHSNYLKHGWTHLVARTNNAQQLQTIAQALKNTTGTDDTNTCCLTLLTPNADPEAVQGAVTAALHTLERASVDMVVLEWPDARDPSTHVCGIWCVV